MPNFKIAPEISKLPTINLSELNDLQGNLKDLSEKDFTRLAARIEKFGFKYPFYVWFDKQKKAWTLDGNQRKRVVSVIYGETVEVPYIEVSAKNKTEAKKEILAISSDYGKVTKDGWDEFAADFGEVDMLEIGETTAFGKWFDAENTHDYSDKNKEIDTDEFSDKMTLKFELQEAEYHFIVEVLSRHDASKENALLKILKYNGV